MEKNTLAIRGMRLAYLEQNPAAENTIFFIHGNSTSSASWKKQFTSELLSGYRLVAIDLPAHGDSSASPEPEKDYSLGGMASTITEAIDQLSKGPYILCGISLGTSIMSEMIPFGIVPAGMFFGGPTIMGKGFGMEQMIVPGADASVLFRDDSTDEEISLYGKLISNSDKAVDHLEFRDDFKKVKSPFRSLFIQSVVSGKGEDGILLANKMTVPMAWVFGKEDGIINPDYLDTADIPKWKDKIFKLQGASHIVQVDAPGEFNLLLADFAEECFLKNS